MRSPRTLPSWAFRILMLFNVLAAVAWGLHIPWVSYACIPLLLLANFFLLRVPRLLFFRHPVQTILLLLFVLFHFSFSVYYGFAKPFSALSVGTLIVAAYLAGIVAGSQRDRLNPDFPLFSLHLLGLAVGFTVFAFLSGYASIQDVQSYVNQARAAKSIWLDGEPINGPMLGILASAGICTLPAFLFRGREATSGPLRQVRLVLIPLLVLFGLYANFIFQNRSPYIALAGALLTGLVYHYLNLPRNIVHRVSSMGKQLLVLAAFGGLVYLLLDPEVLELGLARFQEEGVKTERTLIWTTMLSHLTSYPFGGKLAPIDPDQYAHNLWLDAAFTSGFASFAVLVSFHLMHLRVYGRILRHLKPQWLAQLILGLTLSMLVACLGEPVMEGSPIYFCATCFLLGALAEFSRGTQEELAGTFNAR